MNDYVVYKKFLRSQGSSLFLLVILMLLSMNPWFTYFYMSSTTKMLMASVLAFWAFMSSRQYYTFSGNWVSIPILFVLAIFINSRGNLNAYLGDFFHCIPFLFFIYAHDDYKSALLDVFNKVFWWIVAVSLFFWLLFLAGIPFPHDSLISETYSYENYYFFLGNIHSVKGIIPRFCSIFLEPGYVACYIAFMLYINKYNFRDWHNGVYFVALIMTFSMAGWLLFFVGIFPYVRQNGRLRWAYLLSLVGIMIIYFNLINSSDNNISVLVGDRIRFEDGAMAGYNRANLELKEYWEKHFWNSDNIWWGLGERYSTQFDFGSSVDMRAYIIRYGLVATLLYVIFMLVCLWRYRSWFGLWFFIIVFAFVYRGYSIMFWEATLFVYLAGLTMMKQEADSNAGSNIINRGISYENTNR